jgi:glycosyltransferase involved in cell wall biosynthesis
VLVEQHGLAGIVSLAGYTQDMEAVYRQADLFVLPSLTEGLPNVLLEAAMHRVPIVATRVGGIPALFKDGQEACLVEANNIEALASALECYLECPERFIARAELARERVRTHHSPEEKAAGLLEAYRSLAVIGSSQDSVDGSVPSSGGI